MKAFSANLISRIYFKPTSKYKGSTQLRISMICSTRILTSSFSARPTLIGLSLNQYWSYKCPVQFHLFLFSGLDILLNMPDSGVTSNFGVLQDVENEPSNRPLPYYTRQILTIILLLRHNEIDVFVNGLL